MNRLLSSEQDIFVRAIYLSTPRKQVFAAVNQKYGTEFTHSQIAGYIKRHKINSGRQLVRAIGEERTCNRDGNALIKVPGAKRFKQKHHWVWEQANGEIPEGHVVVFLDGDNRNCELENLRCVHRRVLQYMNKTGLSVNTGKARTSAILTAELITRAKKLERDRA